MRNVTLSVEEELLLAARKVALERNTTVNQLVREFLRHMVEEDGARAQAASRLCEHMEKGLYEVGKVTWSREDLYERK